MRDIHGIAVLTKMVREHPTSDTCRHRPAKVHRCTFGLLE